MCQQCFDISSELLDDIPEGERYDILMEYTAFPFAGLDVLRKQLEEFNLSRKKNSLPKDIRVA